MNTTSFVAGETKDDSVDSNDTQCMRLKCGHAFHSSCIFAAFRAGTGCPTCREELPGRNSILYIEEDYEDESLEVSPIVHRLDSERAKLRVRSKGISTARMHLNKATREYRILCETLRSKRKSCIKKALITFRQEFRTEYKAASSKVFATLAEVERIELLELSNFATEQELEEYTTSVAYDYDAKELMRCADVNAADPIQEKFWR